MVFVRDGKVMMNPRLVASLKSFARIWGRNIKAQGYGATFKRQRSSKGRERTQKREEMLL